jgi:hypothetical protein
VVAMMNGDDDDAGDQMQTTSDDDSSRQQEEAHLELADKLCIDDDFLLGNVLLLLSLPLLNC